MSDGLSKETVAIDGLKLVRVRKSRNGEGHSIWVGNHCAVFNLSSEDDILVEATKLEECLMKVFVEVLVPDLAAKMIRDSFDILKK